MKSLLGKASERFPAIHYGELKEICRLKPIKLAKKLGLTRYETPEKTEYWYKDNGSKILFVAHVDTICPFTHFDTTKMRHDTLIFCPTLDDRLGVYIGTRWLPKAGINCDILLTTDEEKGKSTGFHFEPPTGKVYNWMFMFDRNGHDAVCYDYEDVGTRSRLENVGYKVGKGNYSCIADMEHLGIKGFNFGTAYFANHDLSAHASKKGLTESLRKFLRFYKLYGHVSMPHKTATTGYAEFSKMVDKHVNSKKDFKVGPSEDINNKPRKFYESMGLGKVGPRYFESYGEMKRQLNRDPKWLDFQVTMVVTKDYKTRAISRIAKLLYLSIDLLEIDASVRLILKNTCSIKTIYDLVQWSRWKLLATRKFSLQNIIEIEEELQMGGFSLGYNVQGLQTPQQFDRLSPIVKKKKAKSQKKIEKVTPASEPKSSPLTEKGGLGGKKIISLIPMPPESREKVFAEVKELQGKYNEVSLREPCSECKKPFEQDLSKEEIGPQLCPSCLSQARKSSIVLSVKDEVGAGLGTKFILERGKNDNSIYKYFGKRKGWQWFTPPDDSKVTEKIGRDYARTNAGFTSQRAQSL